MNYSVWVEETLSRVVEVEAESEADAIKKVREMYRKSEIVLGADDLSDTHYYCVEV